MKALKLIGIFTITLFVSCGSTERVITNDGEVYKVKGNNFYKNGTEVTDNLTEIEKQNIQSILEKRLEAEELAKSKQEAIEKALDDLKDKEKELKQKQKALENKIKLRQEAREDFFDLRKNLDNLEAEYKTLKDEGELSPNDDTKWQKRLKKLEKELKEAELKINN